jgi:hypothetical protein
MANTTGNIKGEIRLAGGSYLSSHKTCHGNQRDRKLFVDKETANTHISIVGCQNLILNLILL